MTNPNPAAPRPTPRYPMVQCLNGSHPAFDIEKHPNGCPVHLDAARATSTPAGLDATFGNAEPIDLDRFDGSEVFVSRGYPSKEPTDD